MYYIYRIINKINGKTYIGQHKYKKLNDNYMGSGILLAKAKKKYGIKNFEKEILEFDIPNVELANDWEQMCILFERAKGKAEYNIAPGGLGHIGHHTEETKKRMSKTRTGRKYSEEHRRHISESLKGHIVSEETRKRISDSNKGETAWNKGKKMSDDFRKKCSEAHKGIHPTEETRKKRSESLKGHITSEHTKQKLRESHLRDDVRKIKSEKSKSAKAEIVEAYRKSGRKDWNAFQKEYKECKCG